MSNIETELMSVEQDGAGDGESIETRIDRLLAEYVDRRQRGEAASIDELLSEIPEGHRSSLRECLELIDVGNTQTGGDPSAILPGQKIGGFEVVGHLGRGGMAHVFEGNQPSLTRSVALKILRPALALDSRNRERFQREARSAARLNHPNIVSVHEVGEDQGFSYLAMELVRGKSLAELLDALPSEGRTPAGLSKASGVPSLADAPTLERALAGMLAPVAKAIAHAHSAGILHRDIKPSNILVKGDGQLMVADFGLARGDTDPALSLTGETLGTPHYMAPEQIAQATNTLDARTDIYSLGVTLYETLTGRRPFVGATAVAVFDAIREAIPPRPRTIQSDLSPDAEAVIERAMARDPVDRYPTADHLAEDLERLALGEITEARRSRGGRLRRLLSATGTILSGRQYEHRSQRVLLGLPLLHVNTAGRRPGKKSPIARGWIAIGNRATGVVAIGNAAVGVVSLGILSIGILSFAAALGIGGLCFAGGFAIGGIASGGGAAGYVAVGGAAFGEYPFGGYAKGSHPIDGRGADPEALEVYRSLAPWLVRRLPYPLQNASADYGVVYNPDRLIPNGTEKDMIHPALAAALSLLPADAPAAPIALDNGIQAYVIHQPDAPKQAFFTFLPVGLASDPPDRAQFSHLAEHMMIRSTDPDGLSVGKVMLNGETGASTLRLESIGPADEWKLALSRHASWLATSTVDEETLEREKGRIRGEADSTVANGFVGKWAFAAWNQIVRHGRDHARLIGDIEDATPEQVLEYIQNRTPIGEGVQVIAVGPAPADEVIALIREEFGPLTARSHEIAPKSVSKDAPAEATWDLNANCCMLYAPISVDAAGDRAAALALGQMMMMDLYQTLGTSSGRHPMVSTDIETPEGRYLIASISGVKSSDVEEVMQILNQSADKIADGDMNDSAPLIVAQMARQILGPHDFEAIRGTLKGRPGSDLIEIQATLTQFHTLLGAGILPAEARDAFAKVTSERLGKLAPALDTRRRKTLVLRPQEP